MRQLCQLCKIFARNSELVRNGSAQCLPTSKLLYLYFNSNLFNFSKRNNVEGNKNMNLTYPCLYGPVIVIENSWSIPFGLWKVLDFDIA